MTNRPAGTTVPDAYRARQRPGAAPCSVLIYACLALGCSAFCGVARAQSCDGWGAVFESVEGMVELQARAAGPWLTVTQGDSACTGASIRVGEFGRAALRLPDDSLLRLDKNTSLKLSQANARQGGGSWIDVLLGVIHVISRDPRALQFNTPYANAGLEGTEFVIEVAEGRTDVTVIEGAVLVSNEAGRLSIASGQRGTAAAAQAPRLETVSDRFDRAEWTPYFAPIMARELPAHDARPQAASRSDPGFFAARAARRLGLGNLAAAEADLEASLRLDPRHGETHALRALIALARGQRGTARELALRALEYAPQDATPRIALSYVQQADFELSAALTSLREAVELEPDNAVAWARLAEISLALGDHDASLAAANEASRLHPGLARAQTVLGFALLAQTDTADAAAAFRRALALEQSSPLPRLGLGLALIRQGLLAEGRQEIELAVILDPKNALTRSYMARIYAAENRGPLTESQLELARTLDPSDPTPHLYEALSKQAENRPVDALRALRSAIALNDDRAVYRSRLLVDEDLAARSAGIGQLHRSVGFEQLALLEGWKSTFDAPQDYSGHRLLADVYSTLPRHEIARVNELFQSQLLQPINLTPVQVQLAEPNLFILDEAGPSDLGFNEYGPLLSQNGLVFQVSATAAGNETEGVDVAVGGLEDRFSYSVGYFEFETQGFRDNNDLQQTLANAFLQYRLSYRTSLQAELRSASTDKGDLQLLYDPEAFNPSLRQYEDVNLARIGLRHAISPQSTLLASLIYEDADLGFSTGPSFSVATENSGYTLDLRHLYTRNRWRLNSGTRLLRQSQLDRSMLTLGPPIVPFETELVETTTRTTTHNSAYLLADYALSDKLSATMGASFDVVSGLESRRDALNPKLGLIWEPTPRTTFRTAVFRGLQGPFLSKHNVQPSLAPTHVAGFNQLFLGVEAEDAWRFGVALDQELSETLFAGLELSARDISRPIRIIQPDFSTAVEFVDIDEAFYRAYLYWAPLPTWSFSAGYQYERMDNNGVLAAEGYTDIETRRLPLQVRFFARSRLSAGLTASFVDQSGNFSPGMFGPPSALEAGDDQFWVLDLSLSYRLANRHGALSLSIDNALDERFRFQDIDPENPSIVPERMAYMRVTLSF